MKGDQGKIAGNPDISGAALSLGKVKSRACLLFHCSVNAERLGSLKTQTCLRGMGLLGIPS